MQTKIYKIFLIVLCLLQYSTPFLQASPVYTREQINEMNNLWMIEAKHPKGSSIKNRGHIHVDSSSGQIKYQNIDFHYPGKDGLDLILGRVYRTQESQGFKRKLKEVETRKYLFVEEHQYYFTLEIDGNKKEYGPFNSSEEAFAVCNSTINRAELNGHKVKNCFLKNGKISREEFPEVITYVKLAPRYSTDLGLGWEWTVPSIEPSPDDLDARFHHYYDKNRNPYLIEWKDNYLEGKLVNHPQGSSYIVTRNTDTDLCWRVKDGRGTVTSFDRSGKPTFSSDRFGNYLRYTFDGLGRLSSISDSLKREIWIKREGNYVYAEITHPDTLQTIKYTYYLDPIECSAYEGKRKEKCITLLLKEVVDPEENRTKYEYKMVQNWYSAIENIEIGNTDDANSGVVPYALMKMIQTDMMQHEFEYTPADTQPWGLGLEQTNYVKTHTISSKNLRPYMHSYTYFGKGKNVLHGSKEESPFGAITTTYNKENQHVSTHYKPKKGEEKLEKTLAYDRKLKHMPAQIETSWRGPNKSRVLISEMKYDEYGNIVRERSLIPSEVDEDKKKYYWTSYFYDSPFLDLTKRGWCVDEKDTVSEKYRYNEQGRCNSFTNALTKKKNNEVFNVSHNKTLYTYKEEQDAHIHTQTKKLGITKEQVTRIFYPKEYGYAFPNRLEVDYIDEQKGLQTEVTKYEHDVLTGLMTKKIESDGFVTCWKYDRLGRVVEENYNCGELIDSYKYIGDHTVRLHRTWERGGKKKEKHREWIYDGFGNLIQYGKPRFPIYSAEYNELQQLVRVSEIDGYTYECEYDSYGEALKIQGPDGVAREIEIDRVGQTTKSFQRNTSSSDKKELECTKTYDGFDRLIESSQGGKKETWTYRLSHPEVATYTDELGRKHVFKHNAYGKLVAAYEPAGIQTFYSYSPLEKLEMTYTSKVGERVGYTTHKRHDETGFVTYEEWANEEHETYGRNAAGSVSNNRDSSNQYAEYQHYPNQKIESVTGYSHEKPMVHVHRSYEQLDHVAVEKGKDLLSGMIYQLANSYDDWERTALQTFHNPNLLWKIKNKYTLCGDLEEVNLHDGTIIQYSYMNRKLNLIKIILPTGESKKFTYHYDDFGRCSELYYHSLVPMRYQYGYDMYGRLVGFEAFLGRGSKPLIEENCSYDLCDNLVESKVEGGLKNIYTYDQRNQLSEWKRSDGMQMNYLYQETGDPLRISSGPLPTPSNQERKRDEIVEENKSEDKQDTVSVDKKGKKKDANHQVVDDSLTLISSDVDCAEKTKERTQEKSKVPSAVRLPKYLFNGLDHLVQVAHKNKIVTMSYDLDGLRLRKNNIYYVYDGKENLVSELNEDGELKRIYAWGNREVLAHYEVESQKWYYYLKNSLHDIIGVIDEQGDIINAYVYDPWGKITAETEKVHVPFRYRGYYWDQESELYFLKARYYDPKTRNFISRDHEEGDLTRPLSLNRYIYCENNPVKYIDPNGNFVVPLIWMYARGVALDVAIDMATDGNVNLTSALTSALLRNLNPIHHIKATGKVDKILKLAKNSKRLNKARKKVEKIKEKVKGPKKQAEKYSNKRGESFNKDYRKLHPDLQKQADKAFEQFKINPRHPGLHFEKLQSGNGIFKVSARINKQFRAEGTLKDGVITWTKIHAHKY